MTRRSWILLAIFLILPFLGVIVATDQRVDRESQERIDGNRDAVIFSIENSYRGCLDRNELASNLKDAIAFATADVPLGVSPRLDNLRAEGESIENRPCQQIRREALDRLDPPA